jgi:hypothetical protein
MTAGAGRSITSTSFNVASSVTQGTTTIALTYDDGHNRIKQCIVHLLRDLALCHPQPSGLGRSVDRRLRHIGREDRGAILQLRIARTGERLDLAPQHHRNH